MDGTLKGLYPDGFFGIKGWRRNQELIQKYAETIIGDVETRAALESMGKLGSVENLIEQGSRAGSRAEQLPYLNALASIVDAIGSFEYQQTANARIDQRLSESLMSAAGFIDVTQREQLAQLGDQLLRAQERSEFDPVGAMESMTSIEGDLLKLTEEAGKRLNNQFIEPLRAHEFSISSTMQQLVDVGGSQLDEVMSKDLTSQVLELAGSQLSASSEGRWSFKFMGAGWAPTELPDMTFREGIARLQSSLVGAQSYVNQELDRRGAPQVLQTRQSLTSGSGAPGAQRTKYEKLEDKTNDIASDALRTGGAITTGVERAIWDNIRSSANSILEAAGVDPTTEIGPVISEQAGRINEGVANEAEQRLRRVRDQQERARSRRRPTND